MFTQNGGRGSSVETLPGRIYIVGSKRKLIARTVDSGTVFFKKITTVCVKGGNLVGGIKSGMALTRDRYGYYTAEYMIRYMLENGDLGELVNYTAPGMFIAPRKD